MNDTAIIHNYLYTTAIEAALNAGIITLEYFNNDPAVRYKSDASPVTEADMAAQRIITGKLSPFGLPMISEEAEIPVFDERSYWQQFWLVDPLDGTKEFISGSGEYTVNIALIVERAPVFGVVYAPVPDLLYVGFEGGSFRIDKASRYKDSGAGLEEMLKEAVMLPCESTSVFTIVASRSHLNKETASFIAAEKARVGKVSNISRGSSLKFCALAEGSADVYPRLGPTMEWDIAAGHAVLRFAGGSVLTLPGQTELTYNSSDLRNPDFIARAKK